MEIKLKKQIKATNEALKVWNKHNPNDKAVLGKKKFDDNIHHKDGNRNNNHISNLEKIKHGEHSSLHNKGKVFTKEHRNNLSKAMTGVPRHSEESKKKISLANKGKTLSVETRKKMSKAKQGKSNPFFGKTHTKEVKYRISEAHKGMKHSEETKRKMSESHRRDTV